MQVLTPNWCANAFEANLLKVCKKKRLFCSFILKILRNIYYLGD